MFMAEQYHKKEHQEGDNKYEFSQSHARTRARGESACVPLQPDLQRLRHPPHHFSITLFPRSFAVSVSESECGSKKFATDAPKWEPAASAKKKGGRPKKTTEEGAAAAEGGEKATPAKRTRGHIRRGT